MEVEVLQWFVSPGDRVSQFDKLCEVQSDKVKRLRRAQDDLHIYLSKRRPKTSLAHGKTSPRAVV